MKGDRSTVLMTPNVVPADSSLSRKLVPGLLDQSMTGIGPHLRMLYDEVLSEQLPDSLVSLLDKLKRAPESEK